VPDERDLRESQRVQESHDVFRERLDAVVRIGAIGIAVTAMREGDASNPSRQTLERGLERSPRVGEPVQEEHIQPTAALRVFEAHARPERCVSHDDAGRPSRTGDAAPRRCCG